MTKIVIDLDSCAQCGACADICYAREVFEMRDGWPAVTHPDKCRLCGHCVAVCPTDSIDHENIPLQDCPQIDNRQLPSVDVIVSTFRCRRSHRRYQDRAVPRAAIRDLISHSRWIPTGENRQFMDWIVLDDPQAIEQLLAITLRQLRDSTAQGRDAAKFLGGLAVEDVDRLVELAVREKRRFFFNSPVVLAGYCDKNSFCAREEATYAAYNISLAAERIGLGTCHIGSIQLLLEEFPHLQHDALGVPENKELQVLLTLGYPVWEFRRMVPRRMPDIKWNP
ncbi:MAG: 4Fe-4S dicluster domain-containing protein [Gemmatimonadales bacterium]|nr:4Fe-4S dicluster domain-containing protein [Gemmatimonadales bacterium]